ADPPDLAEAAADVPPALERIVRHCMEKSPAERFQSAGDLAFALEAISGHSISSETASTGAPRSRRKRTITAIAASLLAAAVIGYLAFRIGPAEQHVPVGTLFSQVTSGSRSELFPSLTPYVKSLAYAGRAS